MDPQSLLADGDFVRALARTLIADRDRADDAAQDAWVSILRRGEPGGVPLGRWLVTVLRNAARQLSRSERRRAERERAVASGIVGNRDGPPSAAEVAEREAARRAVVEELLALDEPHRAALLLRFYDGLPPREVARRLGVPVETARTRIRRGLERLREALETRAPGGREAWGVSLVSLAGLRGASAPSAIAGGVFLMKASTQIAGLAALLILGIGLAWMLWLPSGSKPAAPNPTGGGTPTIATATARDPRNETPSARDAVPESAKSDRAAVESNARLVVGRTVDLRGQPIANARVAAMAYPPTKAIRFVDADAGRGGSRAVHSSADGRFAIPLLGDEARLTLGVEAGGFAPEFIEVATPGAEITIRLERALALTGRIIDEAGAPLANAKITWSALVGLVGFERDGISDPQGNYRVDGLPSLREFVRHPSLHSSRIEVRAPGFAPLFVAESTFTASGKPNLARDWVLNRGVTLKGRVVDDESGEPVSGARIIFWDAGGIGGIGIQGASIGNPYYRAILLETKSDTDGNYVFEHAPGSSLHERRFAGEKTLSGKVTVVAERFGPLNVEIEAQPVGSVVDRDLRLRPNATIRGRVVDESGAPVANIGVFAPGESGRGTWVPEEFASAANGSATTGADGSYSISTVEAFSKKDRTVTVRARLYDARRLRFLPESTPSRNEAEVTVQAGQVVQAPDLIVPRAALQDSGVALPKEVGIVATVVDGNGAPVAGAKVQPLIVGFPTSAITGSDGIGKLVIDPQFIPGGAGASLRVVASAAGFAQADSGFLDVVPGETKEITLALTQAKSVGGRVLRADGGAAVAAFVVARLASESAAAGANANPGAGRVVGTAVTFDDGTFEMLNVPNSTLVLTASASRRAAAGNLERVYSSSETVAAGANDALLRFADDADAATGGLDVTICDASTGKPILRSHCTLLRGSKGLGFAQGTPGQARFDGIVPGEYELRVMAEGYATETVAPIVIAADALGKVTVALGHGAVVRGRIDAPPGVDFEKLEVLLEGAERRTYLNGWTRRIPVGADGNYRVTDVAPGKWRVRAVDWRDLGDERIPSAKSATVGDPIVSVGAAGTETICNLEVVAGGTVQVRIVGNAIAFENYGGGRPTEAQTATTEGSTFTIRDGKGTVLYSLHGLDSRVLALDRGVPVGEVEVRLELPGHDPIVQRATVTNGKRSVVTFDVN